MESKNACVPGLGVETNTSSNVSSAADMTPGCQLYEFVLCAIVIGLICIFGMAGNITSFLVLCKHKTETSAIYLLQAMAVSDSLLLIMSVFLYTFPAISSYIGRMNYVHGVFEYIKAYLWPLAMITHTTTIWLTVLVTVERFRAICKAVGLIRNQNLRGVRLQVLAVWIFSVLYNLPRFFEHQVLHRHELSSADGANCTVQTTNLGDSKLYQIIYSNIIYFPVMYIIPLSTLSYLNYRLIRALNEHKLKKETLTGQRPKDNISLCVVVLVCCFILCQSPALFNQIFWAVLDDQERSCGRFHFYYTKISDVLVVLNSSCNFVIYCLFGKHFRKIFLETLCKSTLCKKTEMEGQTEVTLNGNHELVAHTLDA